MNRTMAPITVSYLYGKREQTNADSSKQLEVVESY